MREELLKEDKNIEQYMRWMPYGIPPRILKGAQKPVGGQLTKKESDIQMKKLVSTLLDQMQPINSDSINKIVNEINADTVALIAKDLESRTTRYTAQKITMEEKQVKVGRGTNETASAWAQGTSGIPFIGGLISGIITASN